MSAKLQTVHVRINDAATGKPTPCRVRFTDGQGKYYAPFGRLTEFARGTNVDVGGNLYIGDKQYAYVDGAFEIALQPGSIHYEISKGPEYTPLNETFDLIPGKLALRLTLRRWIDMRAQGWYSGDGRCHYMTPHTALLEGRAEDLSVVNLLICETTVREGENAFGWDDPPQPYPHFNAVPNLDAFSGQSECVRSDECLVAINTFNSHPRLGSLALLHTHRIVYPLTFGYRTPLERLDNWSLADWCDQCHRKNGLVAWQPQLEVDEGLANAIVGRIDAIELSGDMVSLFGAKIWHNLLNCGIRLPLIGASGKRNNATLLGQPRIYCRISENEPLNYRAWIEAVRRGRSFVTFGPLLNFQVESAQPGDHLAWDEPRRVSIVAEASSTEPFERLEILQNGEVVAEARPSEKPWQANLELELTIARSGWLVARCMPRVGVHGYALTSPIYAIIGGRPVFDDRSARAHIEMLDKGSAWIHTEARFEHDRQRERLEVIFASAKQVLLNRLNS
ncbi:MAG: CehA/McbA family metallohydrolase [Planctomycetes bacterium]|nr:CehA/McbA family metallohydrolase [Planctomycetota bacterium]